MAIIEIDKGSGFCFGVTTAIRKAEDELDNSGHLYCLGDIVHNTAEVERLANRGLETITHEQLEQLHDVKVLLRAHGEPPETSETARRNRIEIIDATCPVVLKLQQRINATFNACEDGKPAPQRVDQSRAEASEGSPEGHFEQSVGQVHKFDHVLAHPEHPAAEIHEPADDVGLGGLGQLKSDGGQNGDGDGIDGPGLLHGQQQGFEDHRSDKQFSRLRRT